MSFFKGLIGFMRCTATWVHALKKSHILPVLYTAFLPISPNATLDERVTENGGCQIPKPVTCPNAWMFRCGIPSTLGIYQLIFS